VTMKDMPLLDLFTRLREAGLPLGIDEYQLALRALQAGFGIPDQAALGRLCRTLWVKSPGEVHLFNYHFRQVMSISTIISPDSGSSTSRDEVMPDLAQSKPDSKLDSEAATAKSASTPSSSTWRMGEEEIQMVQAMRHAVHGDDEVPHSHFIQRDEYFPVTRRQMKQSWRYLRRPIREGPMEELDVEATINKIARQGILLEPVLVPRRVNRAELMLLIDQDGSMVPFHLLSRRLAETVLRGGRLGRAGVYYFYNCPVQYLYHDSYHQEAERIEDILNRLRPERTSALIFSDAGAARGGFNPERIKLTEMFLGQIRKRLRYIAWLNPMPHSRWSGTTAGKIACLVPMFEFSRQGLDDALDVLRGRPMRLEERV
jgi:uncharacterized protein with von Willebrand factor type A (vWA) domain